MMLELPFGQMDSVLCPQEKRIQKAGKLYSTLVKVGKAILMEERRLSRGGYDPGQNNCADCSPTHWGFTVSYRVGHCTQEVLVPRSLCYSMNRYLYGLMQETGETRKGFTPANEAMIMFYSTIMKQASASSCSSGK